MSCRRINMYFVQTQYNAVVFTKINNGCMIKQTIIGTILATIVFCVISYISVMFSLLASVGEPGLKPVTNIGFPYHYYFQFWLNGSDSPNCGWNITNFILDYLIIWIIIVIIQKTIFPMYNSDRTN